MLRYSIIVKIVTILFILPFSECRPLENVPNQSGDNISLPLIIFVAVAATICFVFVVALCSCCQDVLFSAKPETSPHSFHHSNSMEPPGQSVPGTPRFQDEDRVTIEPLPDISVKRTTGTNYGKPMDYNHAVNKGLMVDDWFHGDRMADFPRNQLQYVKEMGNGWFGHVVEGEATKIIANSKKSKVFVKILREDLTSVERAFALHEARKHRDLKQENISTLLGKSFEKQPYLLIYEFCAKGDLKQYLMKNRSQSEELLQNGTLMKISNNIASGISYCHQNEYVLNDLACRNFYLTADGTVKISDCGVSMDLYKDDYVLIGDIAVPIRWTAPESIDVTDSGHIVTKEVTKLANVWSFGVVFWEVLEFAKKPYIDLTNDEVIEQVIRRHSTLLPEPLSPVPLRDKCYQTMKMCWKYPAEGRPTMAKVMEMLNYMNFISNNKQITAVDDFESKWNNLLPLSTNTKFDGDSTSPVPADPVVTKPVEKSFIPSKILPYESDNLIMIEKVPETSPLGLKQVPVEVVSIEKIQHVNREQELEQIDKRNFILTLNSKDLSDLNSSELVQFYEYLSPGEIAELEQRHMQAVVDSQADKDKLKLRETILNMSLDEMDALPTDELQKYLSALEDKEKNETNEKLAKKKEKSRLFSLYSHELVNLNDEELRKARTTLNEDDAELFSRRVEEARAEKIGRENALAMLKSTDFELAAIDNGAALFKYLTPDEILMAEKRYGDLETRRTELLTRTDDELADMPEELFENEVKILNKTESGASVRGRRAQILEFRRKRDEILNLDGLKLYHLWKNGWEKHLATLNDDEVSQVMGRLEGVRNKREEILKGNLGYFDDSTLEEFLETAEIQNLRDKRAKEESRQENLRQKILFDLQGLDLVSEFDNNADELKLLLPEDEFTGVARRVDEIREFRAKILDPSMNFVENFDENLVSRRRNCFTNIEYEEISSKIRDIAVKREKIRQQVLSADHLGLYLMSVEGLDPYLNHLDEQEALAVSQRLEDIKGMRENLLNQSFNSLDDEVLSEYFTDDEIRDLKRRKEARSNEIRNSALIEEILAAKGFELKRLWIENEAKYEEILPFEQADEIRRRLNEFENRREFLMTTTDRQLTEFDKDEFESFAYSLTPEEFGNLTERRQNFIANREKIHFVIANDEDLAVYTFISSNGGLESASKYLSADEFQNLKEKFEHFDKERKRILNLPPEELSKTNKKDLGEFKIYLNSEEFENLSTFRQEALEAREGVMSLNDVVLKGLNRQQLERYFKFLTENEIAELEKRYSAGEKSLHLEPVKDENKFNLFKNVADSEAMVTSTPDDEEIERRFKLQRGPERLSLSQDVDQLPPSATAKDVEEFNSARRVALDITDEALGQMPAEEVESFYQFLTAEESLELQERKQKVDDELSTTFFQKNVPSLGSISSTDHGSAPSTAGASGFMYDELWGSEQGQTPVLSLKKEEELNENIVFPEFISARADDIFEPSMYPASEDESVVRFNMMDDPNLPSFRDYLKTAPTLSTLSSSFDQGSMDYSSDEKNQQATSFVTDSVEKPLESGQILIDFGAESTNDELKMEPIKPPSSLFVELDDFFGASNSTPDGAGGLMAPEINLILATPTSERPPMTPELVLAHINDGLVDDATPFDFSTPLAGEFEEKSNLDLNTKDNSAYISAMSEFDELNDELETKGTKPEPLSFEKI